MPGPVHKPVPKPAGAERSPRSIRRAQERAAKAAELIAKGAERPAPAATGERTERIVLTPERAYELLERNSNNRPISQGHVERIAEQIRTAKWRFNGDTIKISNDHDVLDGQHRLWAVIEAKLPVETLIVYGVPAEAFATIDTVRRLRTGGDTVALSGITGYRSHIAMALTWLLRYQRGVLESWKMPRNRIENSDIQEALEHHPGIERAIQVSIKVRTIANSSLVGFAYYVMSNQNEDIANELIRVFLDPTNTTLTHPFFKLRAYFLTDRQIKKDPIHSLALIFKAANLVAQGRESQVLQWRSQGQSPEAFPVLQLQPIPAKRRA